MAQPQKNDPIIEGIRRKGWRQGSIISADKNEVNSLEQMGLVLKDFTHWLLLSHDCDIVHHDFENEPYVEVIAAKMVNFSDGNLLHGKNPRRLQLRMEDKWIELNVGTRRFIERQRLTALIPDNNITIPPDAVQSLAGWVARRYVRTAFPDSFNNRLRPVASDLPKLLKNHGAWISAVYAAVELIELPEEKIYDLILIATMNENDFCVGGRKKEVQIACAQIEALINGKCKGIKIREVKLLAESELSLAEWRKLGRLEFDYLSPDKDTSQHPPRV
jgi:hypothetical protein